MASIRVVFENGEPERMIEFDLRGSRRRRGDQSNAVDSLLWSRDRRALARRALGPIRGHGQPRKVPLGQTVDVARTSTQSRTLSSIGRTARWHRCLGPECTLWA